MANEQADVEEEPIFDYDEEIITIDTIIDNMGWCPSENYINNKTNISLTEEQEQLLSNRQNSGSDDKRRLEICEKLANLKSLEIELANAELKEAEDKYKTAKEKEQSLANRTLGAVTMAATGIGGMELAQGLSEQRIDRESEQDMAAYIETFRCEYANGKSVKNGATNVELPADTLFDLYQEYIALAADLKERKEQLGLTPGIESEVIIDKATAGLYDDKASEKANGTYASIYRAKMGNETDQAKLQEMSDTSGKRVKGGAIAAGAGMVVGIVGNLIINKDTKKQEISTEREKIKNQYNNIVTELVDECNQIIQSHKDFVVTLTQTQLGNQEIAKYKHDVESAQFVHNLSDIKESAFCK